MSEKMEKITELKQKHPDWSPAQIWTEKATEIDSVLKTLRKSGGDFIDDHNGGSKKNIYKDGFNGVVMMNMANGYNAVCPRGAKEYFCLNPFYLGEDGMVHLTTCSVGATVMGSIEKFNKEYSVENLKEKGYRWIIPQQITPISI